MFVNYFHCIDENYEMLYEDVLLGAPGTSQYAHSVGEGILTANFSKVFRIRR